MKFEWIRRDYWSCLDIHNLYHSHKRCRKSSITRVEAVQNSKKLKNDWIKIFLMRSIDEKNKQDRKNKSKEIRKGKILCTSTHSINLITVLREPIIPGRFAVFSCGFSVFHEYWCGFLVLQTVAVCGNEPIFDKVFCFILYL